MDDRALKDFFDRSYELIEARAVKSILNDNFLGAEVAAQENLEQHHRIQVRFIDHTVILQVSKTSLWQHTKRIKQPLSLAEEVLRLDIGDAVWLDLVLRLDIGDHSRQVDRHGHVFFDASSHDLHAERGAVLLELLKLVLEHLLNVDVAHDLLCSVLANCTGQLVKVSIVVGNIRHEVASLVQLLVVHLGQVKWDLLEVLTSHAVLTV